MVTKKQAADDGIIMYRIGGDVGSACAKAAVRAQEAALLRHMGSAAGWSSGPGVFFAHPKDFYGVLPEFCRCCR